MLPDWLHEVYEQDDRAQAERARNAAKYRKAPEEEPKLQPKQMSVTREYVEAFVAAFGEEIGEILREDRAEVDGEIAKLRREVALLRADLMGARTHLNSVCRTYDGLLHRNVVAEEGDVIDLPNLWSGERRDAA
jgi:hypothetical protein